MSKKINKSPKSPKASNSFINHELVRARHESAPVVKKVWIEGHNMRLRDLPRQLRMDMAFIKCEGVLNLADHGQISERDRGHAKILIAALQKKFSV